ncbi:LPXTG cell wall anchor domain-containing protein, partial [Streptococcus agalactiae]|nr:LPXTG cell wall anchor domain-containing protein [Streptococcus agalactiae]MCC9981141.1 LPXTG cell wall anchor domain-containing protein [Streptococcus agalactiae]
MEQSEKKVLAIIAIVIGAIALISSWMPFINNGSFVIAIIALIIGVFALFFNRKRKKTLTYVS